MKTKNRKPNKLINEKSPYLQQHAYNPVDWYPWCSEAFQEAEKRDVPIFLSIGYSTCHWCHVMARESFEDPQVAQLLNEEFVPVKVDREERPDIDNVYMSVCQAISGSGGWPLTVFLTPEKQAFFAGTYYPKEGRYGNVGLMELLPFIAEKWKKDKKHLLKESEKLTDYLKRAQMEISGTVPDPQKLMEDAKKWFRKAFDTQWGGFGASPKFPSPHNLLFLMSQQGDYMEMVEKTLTQMYRGGIFDHIGGGFCRYSTDERWLVPHFEKMLYDNALLLLTYSEAYRKTGKELYRQVAERTATYVLRELTHEEGGFYSSQDADSQGEEGKYYLFLPGEIKEALGQREGEAFCRRFDITCGGNFEGKSIPNLLNNTDFFTQEKEETLVLLREYRKQRIELHRDDKILTGWNGLMIAALAKASVIFCDEKLWQAAQMAQNFVWEHLHQGGGSLLTRWCKGEAAFCGTLEDYAFFCWGLLECYSASFDVNYLEKALLVGRKMVEQFFDREQGGCFFYGEDSEALPLRPKEIYDGAMPSGNSVAVMVMKKLAFYTGSPEWKQIWEQQEDFLLKSVRQPAGHGFFMWYLTQQKQGQLICVSPDRNIMGALTRMEAEVIVKTGDNQEKLENIAPFLKEYPIPDQGAAYYWCSGQKCSRAVTSFEELKEISKMS